MTDEAAFHEGYKRALEDVSRLLTEISTGAKGDLESLIRDLERRIERARCLSNSAMAAKAAGDQGY